MHHYDVYVVRIGRESFLNTRGISFGKFDTVKLNSLTVGKFITSPFVVEKFKVLRNRLAGLVVKAVFVVIAFYIIKIYVGMRSDLIFDNI